MTAPSPRTTVRRLPERGAYDRATIDAILDEALVCHVGFVDGDGQPLVIPTLFVRVGDAVYFHGSPASRTLRTTGRGIEACLTVTLVDGLVMARSAFHHSMNYRSVVVMGRAEPVLDLSEKARILDALVVKVTPDRAAAVRPPNDKELNGTSVLGLSLAEASAKVRTGGPKDDLEDMDWPVWAGVIPVHTVLGEPEPDIPGS